MKVGIDTWILLANRSGTAVATRDLLAAMPPEIQMLEPPFRFPRRNKLTTLLNLFADLFYFHVWLPLTARHLDVVHYPANIASLWSPFKRIVTVHDLTFIHFPEAFDPIWRTYARLFIKWSAKRAQHVVTDSQQSKQDLMSIYHIPADRITVVPLGVSPRFKAVESEAVRRKYELAGQYVLFIGDMMPRKNLLLLVEAMGIVQQTHPDLQLVIVGDDRGDYAEQVKAKLAGMNAMVLGFVPDDDIAGLYSGADVFAFVSVYEGFGMPPLEAMACGTPVLASNTLPDILGDAALFVDPSNAQSIADGLLQLIENPDLKDELQKRGSVHVKGFTWENTANKLQDIYRTSAM
ncbi:MAG: glycosyltransferase family 4 protein [Chloroflexi bacterium]|nr:glycosyltransferase family 4 protein [Chloroflexota bacterium]